MCRRQARYCVYGFIFPLWPAETGRGKKVSEMECFEVLAENKGRFEGANTPAAPPSGTWKPLTITVSHPFGWAAQINIHAHTQTYTFCRDKLLYR
jgi:hypothetical protein